MYLEKLRLDGQAAVVTGGGRGIGLACAEALAEAGAQVVLLDVSLEIAEAGRDYLRGMGFAADSFVLDVTKPAEVTAMADRLGRVDILVANAGIGGPDVPAEDTLDETWLRVNDVNYNGVFWCNRAFGKHMLGAGKGAIVNIGSMSGYIANRPARQTYYNASKAAVHHMTASLAAEWADRGVRVNAVAPTYIASDMTKGAMADAAVQAIWLRDTPMGRVGRPDEIASAVHFLASEAASLITGTTIKADGGFTCW